jgi:hypothetical protein
MAKGMAAKGPSNKPQTGAAKKNVNPRTGKPFKFSIKQLVAKQAAGEQLGPKQIARLQKAGKIAPSTATPTPQLTPQQIEQRVGAATGGGVEQFMNIIGQQGAFQPGSFADQMQAARQGVLQQFERTQAPEFQRQQAEFNQMAAERGLDPNGVAYKTLQQQLTQRQDAAREGVMLAAEQAAQQVQQQGFGQALQGYQAPAAMLGAFAPFYDQFGRRLTEQEQQEIARQKMAQDAQIAREQIQGGILQSRIGQFGQLSPEQQFQMLREKQAGDLALQMMPGQTQPRPSTGSAVAGGLAQGIGAGISSWLGKK